jgi:hypothetical protein
MFSSRTVVCIAALAGRTTVDAAAFAALTAAIARALMHASDTFKRMGEFSEHAPARICSRAAR